MPSQLIISGEVSIKPGRLPKGRIINILILGPTGSGKSTFIEALAGKGQSLGISKDQLAGFTQRVTGYELVNTEMQHPSGKSYPVWLIDTPGFSDSKISELEIVREAKNWLLPQTANWIDFILYLCPITDTRVPGSKRRTIQMLQSLFDIPNGSAPHVTILTTMWDTLGKPDTRERAEQHFSQLRDEVWKEVVSRGGNISRFHNTQESALEVLKVSVENPHGGGPLRHKQYPLYYNTTTPTVRDLYFSLLYQELLGRLNTCQQEIELLQQNEGLITEADPYLEAVVTAKLQEVKRDLAKFLGQLVGIGAPPEGFACRAAQVVSHYLLTGLTQDTQEDDTELSAAIEWRLGELRLFNDNGGAKLVGSCWPHLHPKARFIIFDNLVKLIKSRQKEDRSQCLDPLRQVIALASSTELEWGIRSSTRRLNEDREKLQWQLEHFSPPPPEFAKVRAQLVYKYLLGNVDDIKSIVQIFRDALNQLHGQSDDVKRRKTILQAQLAEAKAPLTELVLALIAFGKPPEGYKRVVFNYRDLSVKGCVAQAKWIAKARLGMKS